MCIDVRVDFTRAVAGLALAVFLPVTAEGQRAGESDDDRARETPTIRTSVYEGLGEAQACIDEDDFECAREVLDDLRDISGLSGFETAQIWTAYASLHVAEERYRDAIAAFENVLAQEGITLAIEQNALYALAQLYGQEEMYEKALDALGRWFALSETPSPDALMLKARFHYFLQEFRLAIEPAASAIRIAEERGRNPDEAWFQLLQYCHIETGNLSDAIGVGAEIVERWPKKQHVVTLAALYGQRGDERKQLALYEAAYEAGWLTSGSELQSYAQLLLAAQIPYKAARILEQGLEEGTVESTPANWRTLAQAWRIARYEEREIPALIRASELADDGELDARLAGAYATLGRWAECVDAADNALDRGVERPAEARIQRGICLVSLERWQEARDAFRAAGRDDEIRASVDRWLSYLESEARHARELDQMREETRRLRRALSAVQEP